MKYIKILKSNNDILDYMNRYLTKRNFGYYNLKNVYKIVTDNEEFALQLYKLEGDCGSYKDSNGSMVYINRFSCIIENNNVLYEHGSVNDLTTFQDTYTCDDKFDYKVKFNTLKVPKDMEMHLKVFLDWLDNGCKKTTKTQNVTVEVTKNNNKHDYVQITRVQTPFFNMNFSDLSMSMSVYYDDPCKYTMYKFYDVRFVNGSTTGYCYTDNENTILKKDINKDTFKDFLFTLNKVF